jgi:hypothetical protein
LKGVLHRSGHLFYRMLVTGCCLTGDQLLADIKSFMQRVIPAYIYWLGCPNASTPLVCPGGLATHKMETEALPSFSRLAALLLLVLPSPGLALPLVTNTSLPSAMVRLPANFFLSNTQVSSRFP